MKVILTVKTLPIDIILALELTENQNMMKDLCLSFSQQP